MSTKFARNWISYLTDSLVNSGAMPSWDALEYLTTHLLGESPNRRLHETKVPYEAIQQFLQRVYGPIVEAAGRDASLPAGSTLHTFTDISLIGPSSLLVVCLPGTDQPAHLVRLDSVLAWDLVFPDGNAFNEWAEGRHREIVEALTTGSAGVPAVLEPAGV